MIRWQTAVGGLLGLIIGLVVLALAGERHVKQQVPSGPILSECDGHLRDLVIHYDPSARDVAAPVFHDLLRAIDADVTVYVVCSNRAAFAELTTLVGPCRCRLLPIEVRHPITTWSRDRWAALAPLSAAGITTLWSPRAEAAEEIWPARAGDERVGQDLAAALPASVQARRSGLYFDAGDFLADGENVFVAPRVLQRNIQHTVTTREGLLAICSKELKRRVILLNEAPDHHVGMFMVAAGQRRVLVGDPSLGRRLCAADSSAAPPTTSSVLGDLPDGPDFSGPTQRLFDAVADQCAGSGYSVTRLPVVPARDGRSYLTYANVLIDQHGRRRIVYLPFYRGLDGMNAAARSTWQALGFEVRPVDCTSVYRHFGCLHCLVNVLRRS